MVAEPTLIRIEEHGRVALPASVRKRFGIKEGELVAVVETPEGVLIVPREAMISQALDRVGAILREEGLTLDELIASGRDERDTLVRELYGIESPDSSDAVWWVTPACW
jgi:AbrB family looped-hinge helix DNA binding protein